MIPENLEHVDALLVLGRGIDAGGELSQSGRDRVPFAIEVARRLFPKVVVFSGGRSWVQARDGVQPPSEGGASLDLANEYLASHPLTGVRFTKEETSESTAANMANSKNLLGLPRGGTLGIVSDELHFLHGRPQYLAGKVFPRAKIFPIILPMEYTPAEARTEQLTTLVTRMLLLGIRPGDTDAIMQRQHRLEDINATVRPRGGASQAYAGE